MLGVAEGDEQGLNVLGEELKVGGLGKADLVDFPVVLNFIHSRHANPAISHVSGTQPPRVFQPVRKNPMKAVDSANV